MTDSLADDRLGAQRTSYLALPLRGEKVNLIE